MTTARLYLRRGWLIQLPLAVVAVCLIVWLAFFVLPMPPSRVVVSSGNPDGVYHTHAMRYKKLLAERGIDVVVTPSEGSMQNLERLAGRIAPRADLAFIQGGLGAPLLQAGGGREFRTVAQIGVEPLWLFSRVPGITTLGGLRGLRVSLGEGGSGARRLATELLAQARMTPEDVVDLPMAQTRAATALAAREIDAALFVAASSAGMVRQLVTARDVELVQLRQTAALIENLPYLQLRLLPQGALDDAGRAPVRDTTLLVTTASLVAREDLHPALQRQFAEAARLIHSEAGPFQSAGDFPSLRRLEYPAAPEARRTLAGGLPWIEERFSFKTAQLLWRLIFIALPIALLALALGQFAPAWLRWAVDSRIARWYGELKYIENDLGRDQASPLDLTRYFRRLERIETRMAAFTAPAHLVHRWWLLRHHVRFVRGLLEARRGR